MISPWLKSINRYNEKANAETLNSNAIFEANLSPDKKVTIEPAKSNSNNRVTFII